jgi:hypothetical protein
MQYPVGGYPGEYFPIATVFIPPPGFLPDLPAEAPVVLPMRLLRSLQVDGMQLDAAQVLPMRLLISAHFDGMQLDAAKIELPMRLTSRLDLVKGDTR